MPNTAGTLEKLVLELGKALEPLKEILKSDIFARLGVELPPAISGNGSIQTKLTQAASKADELTTKITELVALVNAPDPDTGALINKGAEMIAIIIDLVTKLKEVGDALSTAANGLSGPDKTKLQEFAAEMALHTLEYVVIGYLDKKMPALTNTLALIGLIDKEFSVSPKIEVSNLPREIIPRRFYFDQIPKLFNDPERFFQDVTKWGTSEFSSTVTQLLRKIQGFLASAGLPASIYIKPGNIPVLEAYFFSIQLDTTGPLPGLQFEFNLPGNANFNQTVNFSDLWKGTISTKASFAAGITGKLSPPFNFNVKPPSGNLNLDVLLGLKAEKTSGDPILIIGDTGGSRLEAKSMGGSIGTKMEFTAAGGEVLPSIQLSIEEGKLIIDFSKGDGFIQTILAGIKLEAEFSLLGNWNPKDGLRLQGSGGIELLIPLHIDLAIIEINGIFLKIGFSTETPLRIDLATNIKTNLGPLVGIVDRIGVKTPITFPDGGGNLGFANIGFDFLPPTGIGLSIDTGVIKGGGFLSLDYDKGEYFGVMELSFQNFIDLKAIGIVNTKMPDGSTGFSMLILVTAEFTPIQLGFGFTLNGVGGLLGLNRSTDLNALRAGVKTGAVKSILFPEDVVANVTRIISDLKTIFPITQDHFIIAPMAKIGWGTPTLISLELGIIIDIPSPKITILGVLKCILPTEEAAILKLQVNFAGGIDFEEGLIWFDASLFDSRLLVFTLSGDMALRIGWGNTPMFIISVGGFHPAFKEVPSDLTGMTRLTISILSGDNPRISIQTYFAITSNTVQSGAKVELYAEACGFNVYGYLGYDLLVQFSPFHFIAEIYAGLALRSGTSVIAGIKVYCQLSGPTPWHAVGEAELEILFFSISVGFDVTWGEDAPSQPTESIDVLGLIKTALEDSRNWKAELPANTNTNVSLKQLEQTSESVILQPFTILSVSQKVAPLEYEIDRFGYKKPSGDKKFTLNYAAASTEEVREEFAVSNFTTLSDSEKLSKKSFEKMKSGIRFQKNNDVKYGTLITKEVDYELSYVLRKKALTLKFGLFKFLVNTFDVLVKGNSISRNTYSFAKRKATTKPARVDIQETQYMVVNTSDLAVHAPGMVAHTEAEAYQLHDNLVKKDPSLKNKIQVVSNFELN